MIQSFVRGSILIAALVSQVNGETQAADYGVYWDVGHGVVDNYRATGRYSVLVNLLAPEGFQFTEGTAPLNDVPLGSFNILVLANGSFADTFPTAVEVDAVDTFLQNGGSVLIMSDVAGSSGVAKIQQFANLFGAQVGLSGFPSPDVFSTSVLTHPSVTGVDQVYLRFSSTISPGTLTPYVFHGAMPMLAAGEYGRGRIVLVADGDLFTEAPGVSPPYINRADNRQLANSIFSYLAVPEPDAIILSMISMPMLLALRRRTAKCDL